MDASLHEAWFECHSTDNCAVQAAGPRMVFRNRGHAARKSSISARFVRQCSRVSAPPFPARGRRRKDCMVVAAPYPGRSQGHCRTMKAFALLVSLPLTLHGQNLYLGTNQVTPGKVIEFNAPLTPRAKAEAAMESRYVAAAKGAIVVPPGFNLRKAW